MLNASTISSLNFTTKFVSAFHPNLEVVGLPQRLIPTDRARAHVFMASLEDVHLAKPKSSCKRGAYAPSAVQKRAEIGTINAIALCERGLTSLAFNCRSHQISNVIVIKHQEIIRFSSSASIRRNQYSAHNCSWIY